jgi:hypothetical protein
MTYPACGCTSECRFCGHLNSKRDKTPGAKPVACLVVFKPGVQLQQVQEAMKALGKDVMQFEAVAFDPAQKQVRLTCSAIPSERDKKQKGDSHGESQSQGGDRS